MSIMSEQTRLRMLVSTYDAIHDSIALGTLLTVRYATGGTVEKRRTIKPLALHVGRQGDLVYCEDSLRGYRITMRVDRLVSIETTVKERV